MLKRELKGNVTSEGMRHRSPDLMHKGGCQGHCTRDDNDNASAIHLVHQLGIEPGAQRWQQQQYLQQCQQKIK